MSQVQSRSLVCTRQVMGFFQSRYLTAKKKHSQSMASSRENIPLHSWPVYFKPTKSITALALPGISRKSHLSIYPPPIAMQLLVMSMPVVYHAEVTGCWKRREYSHGKIQCTPQEWSWAPILIETHCKHQDSPAFEAYISPN